jgi:hypothetical protein
MRCAILIALVMLIAGGCRSARYDEIRVTYDADSVKDCTKLSSFSVTSGAGGWAHDAGFPKNEQALKARTVRDGGDTLLITQVSMLPGRATVAGARGAPPTRNYVYRSAGESYRCKK